jgi:diguanylate cyclase (GGDEF)-like protein
MDGVPDTMSALGKLFDRLMPFHVLVDRDGYIQRCGPTLAKLAAPNRLEGQPFLGAFALRRPRDAFSFAALRDAPSVPLRLALAEGDHPSMRGLVAPLPDGRTVVNLTFGISVVDAVARYHLTADDFPATDLAVEMLYLVEAQSAALEESRRLNVRLEGAKIAAEEQAYTDTLTGLKNRRAIEQVAERLLSSDTDFGIVLVDLDHFKDVNDTLGHAAGDAVLQAVARGLLSEIRPGDTVVRMGGDEFAIVTPDLRDGSAALALGQRIVRRLEAPVPYGGQTCRISASIGIALSQDHPLADFEALMSAADAVLYDVKNGGRGHALVAPPTVARGAPDRGDDPDPVMRAAG